MSDGGDTFGPSVRVSETASEPFRGTRVPVKSLFDHLSAGDSLEAFLDDFPGVTREHVQAVVDLAGLHLLEVMR